MANKGEVKKVEEILSGMPCTNRETAAEKAAAHRWMEKERARRRPRNLRVLEQLKLNR